MRRRPPRRAEPAGTRLDSLTGARFVAAFGVFLYHAGLIFSMEGAFGRALGLIGREGSIGVSFFFALSGFVLAWSWRPGLSTGTFYRRRFARIAPAYWVALVGGLIWTIVVYHDPIGSAIRTIPSTVGLQAWFPDPAVHYAANGVEWSVSAELFFYAAFPLMHRLAQGRAGRRALVVAAVLLGLVAPLVLPLALPGELGSWLINVFPLVRSGEFLSGLLLAVALREGRRVPIGPRAAVVLFLVCYFLLPATPSWVPQRGLLLASMLLVIAALAQADLTGARTIAARRVPVRLGEWSYCFYLVHQITSQVVLFVCARSAPPKLLGPIWLMAALLASVALAALLHHVVERPLERRLRGSPVSRLDRAPAGGSPDETPPPSLDGSAPSQRPAPR